MKQSQELTKFYRAYLSWVEEKGAQMNDIFSPSYGLCANLREFMAHNPVLYICCRMEIRGQFIAAGLDSAYPFDDGDDDEYDTHAYGHTLHLNPKRIQWVRDHANG